MDVCSPGADKTQVPADTHLTIVEDGLTTPWHGTVWTNPLYGKELPTWMNKLAAQRDGIALVFARPDTKWFQAALEKATVVCFIAGRIKFIDGRTGQTAGSPGAGSALFAFGDAAARAVLESVRKVHAQLRRDGEHVARCTVERLMRREGLQGLRRAKGPRTTIPGPLSERPEDLVDRRFTATAPDCLWVADITYIRKFSGWVYAAFVVDIFSRWVVGWQLSTSLHTELALDALEMGIWTRRRAGRDLSQLIHYRDRGVQYRAIRYTERLADAEAVASVGSQGDSYDNARRGVQLALQIRTRPPQRPLAGHQRPRDRDRRIHRLVRPPPAPRRDRSPTSDRGRE
jgi:hypothetical protein